MLNVIKLKELYEQLETVKQKENITWEDIDPIRNILENKCFKINNELEALFIIQLIEKLFGYKFPNIRYRNECIYNSVDWGYMAFSESSGGGSPDDFANNIFRCNKIDSCFEKDINERYEEVKIRELEIFRGTDID